MPKPPLPRFRTTNWSDYNAALRKRGSLSVWFDPEMVWHAGRTGKRGRPETFSDAAIQTCLTLKVLFGLPLRQTVGLVESLIQMAGLDWPVPDYSALCRRQARITVQVPYRASGQPLNLLVDSSGIKFRGDGEWQARKHGPSRRRQWRKVHIAMDAGTGDVRAVEFTSSRQGDSPLLPELLAQIPPEETIGTVTADGAYDTRRCHGAIIDRGAEAVIPIRRNGRAWKEDCPAAAVRNEILRATRRLGRTLWKKWTGYHVRSRVEAQMNCLKLFGERIMSRDPDRQTAEIQICIAIMNRFSALGRAEIEAVRWRKAGKGAVMLGADLRNIAPEVGAAAGFHGHDTRWHLAEKGQDLIPAQLLAKDRVAGAISSMHLKHVLRQIQTDCGTF